MTTFSIVFPADNLPRHEVEIAIQSFSTLYYNVTPKHRRRMQLSLLNGDSIRPLIYSLSKDYGVDAAVMVTSQSEVEEAYINSSLMLIPGSGLAKKLAVKALEKGLPVLGYDSYSLRNLVDVSCGILIPYKSREDNVKAFAEILQQLYYDPEAQKMLKQGAENRPSVLRALHRAKDDQFMSKVA
jgi:glycosyltransferase involved in cell wall biosynthesis